MNAIILSVGDELALGQTVDTNSAWASQQLAAAGCDVLAHATVADDRALTEEAIREAARRADLVLISGGIGPTEDDLTRQAIADVLGVPLESSPAWLAEMRTYFERTGRVMPERNNVQALIPAGAEMVWNTCGTAAGIKAAIPNGRSDGAGRGGNGGTGGTATLFAMPGVPKEMKAMFARDVLPWVRERAAGAAIRSRTLHTFGLGESAVAERVAALMVRGRNPSVGTTVSGGIVSLRVNARFGSPDEAERELEAASAACHAALGDLIYGRDGEPLSEIVARLLLADPAKPTVATAESCTGGLVAAMLTDVPGSSAYFRSGWVTYANEAKVAQLGVPQQTLIDHGAVSEPTVVAMAAGALERAGATYALAVSGIAGPGGGTPEKPVGTVWFALAHPGGVDARRFGLFGDREMIRDRAAKMALTLLRFRLLNKPLPF
ncbi:MAG: CinA-like protein [Phycisphaerales bacterium]|nr:CinA-like protein [Phycisphaerales bacterium]